MPKTSDADGLSAANALVADYIAAWKAFYPSRAFGYGDRDSARAFEDFRGDRVPQWLELNARTVTEADALLAAGGLDLDTETDLRVLRAQAIDEQANWREDEPLKRQPQWYAERISQALTHLLVREQLDAVARQQALVERLQGVAQLCRQGVAQLSGGNALRTERALRTLAGTRAFYEDGLPAIVERWGEAPGADAADPDLADATTTAMTDAVAAIRALEAHLETLLPGLPADASIGRERYVAKLARRHDPGLTPERLLEKALAEMRAVRALMITEARRWRDSLDAGTTKPADSRSDDALLAAALEAMEADREDNSADFLAQFEDLTAASERFVIDNAIATVPQPTTLYVALSPAHFSGAAVGGVYPSGPFDPSADTLFYVPSVPDDAPAEVREGFYRSFNDHFNAMIISHEMFPGHYLQYKVAVSQAPAVRSLFSNGAYTEGWGTFTEVLLLDAGWAGNAPLTRLAHLRKRLENATRATVSVQVHTAGWGREQVLEFAREEGLLAPQFAENLWQRVVNSPLQITDYFVGDAQFRQLYAARAEGPLRDWVDAVLRAGPVPLALLPPLLEEAMKRGSQS
jgi:uncharacterized protein (DUF885 family)